VSAPDPGGFHVDLDDLGARATAVDRQAERLRTAAGSAHPVDASAYGFIGQQFADSARTAATEAAAALAELSTATAGAATTLRLVQAAYLDVERIMAARFRELGL
jgi:hypothetical protein